MSTERRKNNTIERAMLIKRLNTDQRITLNNIEKFGWELRFIRQSSFSDSVPIVKGPDGVTIGILEEDGKLNVNIDIQVRDS